jgi:hypothetical protein
MNLTMLASTSTFGFAPAWVEMWVLALAIYATLKLLTWLESGPSRAKAWRSAAYLLGWPGMDARTFLLGRNVGAGLRVEASLLTESSSGTVGRPAATVATPRAGEWLFAASKFGVGLILIAVAACAAALPPWLRAWIGTVGIVFVLHFGAFHLLSCWWRAVGIPAAPIMHWPVAATSLLDFWSRRWNLAFRDLTHRYLFRPVASRWSAAAALWLGFLVSGVIHDAVISLPAGGGYGLPTLFFLIQAAGISVERSSWGKGLGLGRGTIGWPWTAAVLIVPSPLLVHEAFRDRVVLPMLDELRLFL